MHISLRPHQKDAVKGIKKAFKEYNKCLVKSFCGTGKTIIIFYLMMKQQHNLSVIVFPSISLITQFNTDYLLKDDWKELTEQFNLLSICSKNELTDTNDIKYITDKNDIIKFLNEDIKIICCTYQSFHLLVDVINETETTIDLLVYDEAHHIIGSEIQKLVFNDDKFTANCHKTIFLTATPRNDNGIIMLEREYDDIDYNSINEDNEEETITYKTDLGTLAYEYTHYQAVQDGICNDFNIAIDFYTDNSYKYKSVYSAISRCIFNTHNMKCLTFHSRSEVENNDKSFVMDFISDDNVNKFKQEYNNVLINEFKSLKKRYIGKLQVDGLTAKTKNKQNILKDFDEDTENVRVLASCNTIGEGIDTKNANVVCFVDPKSSYTAII